MSDDVLPFEADEADVVEGIGTYASIVDLSEHRGDGRRELAAGMDTITSEGRCYLCGYDRGRKRGHTEVPGYVIRCEQCDAKLIEEGPR